MKTKEMCHSTYKMGFLMAEQQNALASWISKAAPFITVVWVSKSRTSWSLSTAVSENWSATILKPCLCCEPWKASSYTAGFCASINKRLEKDNFYCCQSWLQNRNFTVLILLVSQGNCPFMHTTSSSAFKFSPLHADAGCILWESENNKAWCKGTICFPWGSMVK